MHRARRGCVFLGFDIRAGAACVVLGMGGEAVEAGIMEKRSQLGLKHDHEVCSKWDIAPPPRRLSVAWPNGPLALTPCLGIPMH